ncbi:MAG: hypothetical protein JW751_04895 [Polyangiaceae bacterium]|nr:hypothetical protein [Polyangiaceae bacterium]
MTPVEEEAPDLVAVVADADVEALLKGLLMRGVERRCLRQLRCVPRRETMRDAGVRQSPLRSVPDLKPGAAKLLVIRDHHGCGKEDEAPADVEAELTDKLVRAGFDPNDARCLVLAPELEEVLVPVWDRVAELMAAKRQTKAPSHAQILAALGLHVDREAPTGEIWTAALSRKPKECFLGLLRLLNLRHQTALYEEIAREVSLVSLKEGSSGRRLGEVLVRWFGMPAGLDGGESSQSNPSGDSHA